MLPLYFRKKYPCDTYATKEKQNLLILNGTKSIGSGNIPTDYIVMKSHMRRAPKWVSFTLEWSQDSSYSAFLGLQQHAVCKSRLDECSEELLKGCCIALYNDCNQSPSMESPFTYCWLSTKWVLLNSECSWLAKTIVWICLQKTPHQSLVSCCECSVIYVYSRNTRIF